MTSSLLPPLNRTQVYSTGLLAVNRCAIVQRVSRTRRKQNNPQTQKLKDLTRIATKVPSQTLRGPHLLIAQSGFDWWWGQTSQVRWICQSWGPIRPSLWAPKFSQIYEDDLSCTDARGILNNGIQYIVVHIPGYPQQWDSMHCSAYFSVLGEFEGRFGHHEINLSI